MSALSRHLAGLIAREGPISVATYMATALQHPEHGYYTTRDPLGRGGDFITAPEISQMFGECIGAWLVAVWHAQGAPKPFALVELGPGRGTLMADILRTARKVAPDFVSAAEVHLIESSPALRARQKEALDMQATWHDHLRGVPKRPLFLIANEFFDALPIRQFVRTERGWCERCIALADTDAEPHFRFVVAPEPIPEGPLPDEVRNAPLGSLVELCPAGESVAAEIGGRLTASGGVALVMDYGHARSAPGDTFQAVKGHRLHDPLVAPGSADLTAHVDFGSLARAVGRSGARAHGPLAQGEFLRRLGIRERAQILRRSAPVPEEIDRALERLTAPDAMGDLFKAFAVTPAGRPPPPAF